MKYKIEVLNEIREMVSGLTTFLKVTYTNYLFEKYIINMSKLLRKLQSYFEHFTMYIMNDLK